MAAEVITLDDAVRLVHDGDTLAMEGSPISSRTPPARDHQAGAS
jgi:hypothetical protein